MSKVSALAPQKRLSATTDDGTTLFDSGDYAYDSRGNITGIGGSQSATSWVYQYDALSRLLHATPDGDELRKMDFAYDDFGNLLGGVTASAETNRLQGGFVYDERGNVLEEPVGTWVRHLSWDVNGRLMSAWADGSGAPAKSYGFAYDHSGERVLKYEVSGGAAPGVTDATGVKGHPLSRSWGTPSFPHRLQGWPIAGGGDSMTLGRAAQAEGRSPGA